MGRPHALIEEAVIAAVALALIATFIAVTYWYATGLSPWPVLVLCEAVAFSWGLIIVIATSPSRGR